MNRALFAKIPNVGRFLASQSAATALLAMLQLTSVMILSRILTPADFGYAATSSALALLAAALSDVGFGAALIRVKKLTRSYRAVVLSLATAAFAIASILSFLLNALIWHQDNIFLLAAIYSLAAFLIGISGVLKAPLQRDHRYFTLFIINGGSYFVGMVLVAVSLGLLGMGPYALAYGQLIYSAVMFTSALFLGGGLWRMRFSRFAFIPLFRFGSAIISNRSLDMILSEGDKLFMAAIAGFSTQGYFERINRVAVLAGGHMSFIIDSVLYPVFSRNRGSRARADLHAAFILPAALLSIVFLVLAMSIKYVVAILLGTDYVPFAPVALILVIGAYFRAQSRPVEVLFRAHNKGKYSALSKLFPAFMLLLLLVAVADKNPIYWAWAFAISQALGFFVQLLVSKILPDTSNALNGLVAAISVFAALAMYGMGTWLIDTGFTTWFIAISSVITLVIASAYALILMRSLRNWRRG